MRILRLAAIATGLVLSFSSGLWAQRPDSTSLAQLRPNRFVRVETPELGRITGTVAAFTTRDILLVNGSQHLIGVDRIERAWVRGRHTKTGAIIGGIIGAGGGVFLGLLAQAFCEDGCGQSYVVPAGLIGAGVGAGAGAVVGTAFPRWKELH